MSELEEQQYKHLADDVLKKVEAGLEAIDADDVDVERAGDVLTLTFRGGARCVLNTQRPTRQMWLAAHARAWHFSYDPTTKQWLDDKQHTLDLFEAVKQIVKQAVGLEVSF